MLAALAAVIAGLAVASAPLPPVAAAPAVSSDRRSELPPIYALLDVRNEVDRRIAEAERVLITACMAEHGFQYSAADEPIDGDEVESGLRLFGLESPADLAEGQSPSEPPGRGEDYHRALFGDPDKRIVATGARVAVSRPATGCLAEAEHGLLGDLRPRRMQLRMQLFDAERDTREQLDRDAEFQAANARWRACVNGTGVDAPDPLTLLADLPGDADLRAHPAVLADLLADLRCKAETGYLPTAYGRLTAIQQAWLDDHPEIAADWNSLRQRQYAAARRVLGS